MINITSENVIYSEHDYDECFEYRDGRGRVPEGIAIGFTSEDGKTLTLFRDIKYSAYDHKYWDNYELETDLNRVIIP